MKRSWGRLWGAVFILLAWGGAARAGVYEVAQRDAQASDQGPGTAGQPWKTLAAAARKVRPGDIVRIRGGVYRESVSIRVDGTQEAPIRFEAAPGEWVVVTGADLLTGWQRTALGRAVYSIAWPHRFIDWNDHMTHPDDEYHRVIGRCEQVVVNGYLLRQVLSAEQLAPGTFVADPGRRKLLLWDSSGGDPNQAVVEGAVRQEICRVEGDYIQLRGLRFRYAANMAQNGAVRWTGAHGLMEDCVVEGMNASGATFGGEDLLVRRCVFRENGQEGFDACRAHRLRFTGCLVENNNTKNFERDWEAGGNKLALCRDVVLEQSRFLRNRGNGIWFDIGNMNGTVRQCLIAENEGAGIFYEISFGLQAHDNVVVGNGFADRTSAWGGQAGISLSSSPDCVIERNLLVGNREGVAFREQKRTTATIESEREIPVWNHDETIRNNLIAFNRDAQVGGWFDADDQRHWPAKSAADRQQTPAGPDERQPVEAGQPTALTLERLRLRFADNVYWAAAGQGWFQWGPPWARHEQYASLAEFRSGLGLDTGGQAVEPPFANAAGLDFRLAPERMEAIKHCYPQGAVPGVILGERHGED